MFDLRFANDAHNALKPNVFIIFIHNGVETNVTNPFFDNCLLIKNLVKRH